MTTVPITSSADINEVEEIDTMDERQLRFQDLQNVQHPNTRHSISQDNVLSGTGLPGAAFNTTPIYDAQGSLVGLQTPMDCNPSVGDHTMEQQDQIGYMATPPMYPYNVPPQNSGNLLTMSCNPYSNFCPTDVGMYNSQQKLAQYKPSYYGRDQLQRPLLISSDNPALMEAGQTTVIRGHPSPKPPTFDSCPIVCSLFAIFCCPITLWCSLPALVYSLCAYTDHRTARIERSQSKSDIARQLIIAACVIGLLLCITWAILAFFYYEVIVNTVSDILRVLQHRLYSSS